MELRSGHDLSWAPIIPMAKIQKPGIYCTTALPSVPVSRQSPHNHPPVLTLVSAPQAVLYPAVVALSIVVPSFQGRAYDIANREKGSSVGKFTDADFYSTLQTSIMQIIGLCFCLRPLVWHSSHLLVQHPRRALVSDWT